MSEKCDVIKLCQQVLDMSLNFYDNPNGGYEYTCPMCYNRIEISGRVIPPTMSTFKHDINCGYLIAKDLLTGYEGDVK